MPGNPSIQPAAKVWIADPSFSTQRAAGVPPADPSFLPAPNAEHRSQKPESAPAQNGHPRSHTTVRPIRPHELSHLVRIAAAEDQTLRGVTHVVLRDGHIIGGLAFTHHVALCNVWMSAAAAGAMDSLEALSAGKAIAAEHGNSAVIVPCAPDSPFHDKLAKFGFTEVRGFSFHIQSL